jgi:hypothetical protein
MTSRLERGTFERGKETFEAHAGSVLSLLGVVSPLVRARTIGPKNEDGHLRDTYPLTPLHWRVANTRLHQIGDRVLAQHRDVVEEGVVIRPYAPKDLPNAGINAAPADVLRYWEEDESIPVVYWPYGDRLLAAEIPERHLAAANGEHFRWASRFAEFGSFGAGKLFLDGSIFPIETHAVESLPAREVQAGTVPAY